MMIKLAATLLLLLTTACNNLTGADSPSMTGTWTGQAAGVDVRFDLSENDGSIGGSGELSRAIGRSSFEITGERIGPGVVATMRVEGGTEIELRGALTGGNSILGWLNGGEFPQAQIHLNRTLAP